MYKSSSLILSFLLTAPALSAMNRGGAELLNPQAYSVDFTTSMFNSSGYYTIEGVELDMPDGYKYQMIDADLSISYGVSRSLELTGMGRFRSVSSTMGETKGSKSGPESLGLEGKYAFDPIGNMRYAVGAHYRQTLYSNTTTAAAGTEEIDLGDAGSEYGVDLYVTYLGTLRWDGRIGYNSPANNLSEEVPYKIEGTYRFTKLGVFAGVEGIYSIGNDAYSDTPAQKPAQNHGSTALFNSINREKVAPYLGASYTYSNTLMFGIKGQTVMSGTSTDKGNTISLNLVWGSQGVTPESVKIDAFKEYNIDGSVLKVSARGNFIRIDQGLSTDVEKGMKFDIYQTDYFGGNVLVGSGVVYEVGTDWSVIKLLKKYKDIQIKPGFAARGH